MNHLTRFILNGVSVGNAIRAVPQAELNKPWIQHINLGVITITHIRQDNITQL